jgi:hypothetical protein
MSKKQKPEVKKKARPTTAGPKKYRSQKPSRGRRQNTMEKALAFAAKERRRTIPFVFDPAPLESNTDRYRQWLEAHVLNLRRNPTA